MAQRRFRFGIPVRVIAFVALALFCIFAGLIALYSVTSPPSTLMLGRIIEGKNYERIYVRLSDIAPAALAAVVASEDANFCQNDGIDWGSLYEVSEPIQEVVESDESVVIPYRNRGKSPGGEGGVGARARRICARPGISWHPGTARRARR
jgi:hypothetical protein